MDEFNWRKIFISVDEISDSLSNQSEEFNWRKAELNWRKLVLKSFNQE
jgi:hypothetical protein